jgi:hypothetical protein
MVLSRGLRALAATVIVIVAVAAGVGWLYLLRSTGALDAGPRLHEALPLERLARHDAQPMLRLAAAWLPAGVCAGIALGAATRLRAVGRALVTGVGGFVVIVLTAGASDAVTESRNVGPYLSMQPHRLATWVAAAFLALGALIAASPRPRRRSRRAWGAASRLPGAGAGARAEA